MLIIFDVDGTLINGETADWACFDQAFVAAAGKTLDELFWTNLVEVTARAIVHESHADKTLSERQLLEHTIRNGYLERLRSCSAKNPLAFQAAAGAKDLLAHLRSSENYRVAIATGDWFETITHKLGHAGLDVATLPMATSSDCYSRAEIIALAAARAGRGMERAVYVGDGPWDLRATRKLGIPFIGVGRRHERLRAEGAEHTLVDLEPEKFLSALAALKFS